MERKRFYYNDPVLKVMDEVCEVGNTFMLFGPPGSGKTSLVYFLAEKNGWELVRITGKESMRDEDMMGTYQMKGDVPVWVEGPLEKAFRLASEKPVVLLVDEITRIPSRYLNVFIEVINDYDYENFLFYNNVTGKEWKAPKDNFKVFATANVNQVGVNDVPEALLDRFEYHVYVDYPSFEDEVKIAVKWGMSEEAARILVTFARITRKIFEDGQLEFPISTRNVVNVARGIGKLKKAGRIKKLEDEISACFKLLDAGCFTYVCGASRGRVEWKDLKKNLREIFINVYKEELPRLRREKRVELTETEEKKESTVEGKKKTKRETFEDSPILI